jgi:hypothetical protein
VIGVTGQSALTNRGSAISIPTVRAGGCSCRPALCRLAGKGDVGEPSPQVRPVFADAERQRRSTCVSAVLVRSAAPRPAEVRRTCLARRSRSAPVLRAIRLARWQFSRCTAPPIRSFRSTAGGCVAAAGAVTSWLRRRWSSDGAGRRRRAHLAGRAAIPAQADHRVHLARIHRVGRHRRVLRRTRALTPGP